MDDSYIKTLSPEEKITFMKIFCCLIRADQRIEKQEIAFLNKLGRKYGLNNATTSEIIKSSTKLDPVQEARKITDRAKALELLKELCVLANADDDLADEELDIIINTARAMGIEDEKIRAVNRWVLDCKVVIEAGLIVMEKN